MSENNDTAGIASSNDHKPAGEQQWGRVLICGGTNWSKLGRKDKSGAKADDPERPDLLEPHILRSLSNVKAVSLHASPSSCHCIVIDLEGDAWLFGRNIPCSMGTPSNAFDEISENAPRRITPTGLGAPMGTKFVHAACGRGHSLLVGSNGDMWSCGGNVHGQCGRPPCAEITSFTLIRGPIVAGKKLKVVKVGAGISFSLCLTEDGKVWGFGSAENGQLGNGKTGEHIATGNKLAYDIHAEPTMVRFVESSKVVDIACGNQHSILIDDAGNVFTFGYNGYCRLGLGDQANRLKPTMVPQFAHPEKQILQGKQIYAGPTCSAVVNGQDMFWLAGKVSTLPSRNRTVQDAIGQFKTTGDGSTGQPWTTFKHVPEIMGCKIHFASLGGVTLWALSKNEDGSELVIGWGQNAANGELGLGPDEIKSAVKPIEIQTLRGLDVFDVAAGQNTTYFLAKPNDKLSDLPRHPDEVDNSEECLVCNKEEADSSPLVCEKCDNPYHLGCLDPPLSEVPAGEWFCPVCATAPGGPIFGTGVDSQGYLSGPVPKAEKGKMKKGDAKGSAQSSKPAKRKAASPTGRSSSKKMK